jgi:hypothetical protein
MQLDPGRTGTSTSGSEAETESGEKCKYRRYGLSDFQRNQLSDIRRDEEF